VDGFYCEDCHVAEISDDQGGRSGVRSYALDGRIEGFVGQERGARRPFLSETGVERSCRRTGTP
jgi:hypothetical protein